MKYNLNFWTEPDWHRENSVNALELAALFALILAISGTIYVIWVLADINDRKNALAMLEREVQQHQAAYTKVRRQADSIVFWSDALAKLDTRVANRIAWNKQLYALQSLVPARIVLQNLALSSSEQVVEKQGKSGPGRRAASNEDLRVLTQYQLRILGVAYGQNADATITDFSRALPKHPEMEAFLESVELTSVRPHNSRGPAAGLTGKEFVIICRYKAFDWSMPHEG